MTTKVDDEPLEFSGDELEYPCPKCGELQSYFIKRGGSWARCPSCDGAYYQNLIPKHLLAIGEPSKGEAIKKKVEARKKVDEYLEEVIQEEEEVKKPVPIRVDKPRPISRPVSEPLFERAKEDWQILDEVLEDFGVMERARKHLTKKCKRAGGMHPQDLQRLLAEFKSGLQKKEHIVVAEEYFEALEAEREKRRSDTQSRSFPYRSSDHDGTTTAFPWRRGETSQSSADSRSPSWDRDRRGGSDVLTPAEFDRMWNERIEKRDQRDREKQMQDTIKDMIQTIGDLQQQIANPSKSEDESMKIYQLMMNQEKQANERQMQLIKDMGKDRDSHHKEMIDVYKTMAEQKASASIDPSGYKDDGTRLLADATKSLTSVIEKNQPVKTIAKLATQPNPPSRDEIDVERKDEDDVGILSKLDLTEDEENA